ncbi:hypothetical protein PV11_05546 [Exophiala sideris]|uniref:Uncharacterized protein n=1 Tax=Exophiala sideris TaxID=1016849 RepID=A0A0D1X6W9_9EURO|nr:hypothetical protein PV11_05546 [Exophiala sideris]
MFSELDTHLEVMRIALRIQAEHEEYERAQSMQGSVREINSALYVATNKLVKPLRQMNCIQSENPGLARMLKDFGRAEKGTFKSHGDDWDGGECIRRIHKYAHYNRAESDGDVEKDDGARWPYADKTKADLDMLIEYALAQATAAAIIVDSDGNEAESVEHDDGLLTSLVKVLKALRL